MRKGKSAMMDDDEGDDYVRAFCCDLVQWFHDGHDTRPATLDELLAQAATVEHYITKGGTIEFNCPDGLRKTVRGG
jgi:hypothetical protein